MTQPCSPHHEAADDTVSLLGRVASIMGPASMRSYASEPLYSHGSWTTVGEAVRETMRDPVSKAS